MKHAMFTMGFVSMMGAAVLLGTSISSAAGSQRVDVIESAPTGSQPDSMTTMGGQARSTRQRVDVIDSISSSTPVYPITSGTMRVDVIDRLEAHKPVRSSTSGTMGVGVIDRLLALGGQSASVTTTGTKVMRVDVIDNLPTEAQRDSTMKTGNEVRRVDVIDSLDSPGDVYPSTSGRMRVDVIDEIRS